jgi:hypothetical protein
MTFVAQSVSPWVRLTGNDRANLGYQVFDRSTSTLVSTAASRSALGTAVEGINVGYPVAPQLVTTSR